MTTIPRPDIPSTIIRFRGQRAPRILPAASDTVMVPLIHDWGPVYSDPIGATGLSGGLQELTSFDAWTQLFGDSDTPGRTAVAGAFAGENVAGAVGAGAVIACRIAGTSVMAASVTINQTGATPGLTLTGKYKGSRGNKFTYTIDPDPSNVLRDRLRLYYSGALMETYLYLQTDVIGLAAQINSRSKMVTASNVEVAPTRLIAGSGAFTLGDDGATLTPQNHSDALTALRFAPASILAPYDVTDGPTQAIYLSWAQAQSTASRPVRVVLGGSNVDTISTALTRTGTFADEHIINLGVGQYHDDLLNKDLTTSQLASRIAGILAARGEASSITYAQLGGLHAIAGSAPTDDAILSAVTGGVTVLMPADSADADLRIAKGVTTWTQDLADKPLQAFGDPRLVGIMDDYTRSMKQWGNKTVIGALPVNEDTRNQVYGEARRLQDELLTAGLILPGNGSDIPAPYVIVEDTDDVAGFQDTIPYSFGWQFAKTANAILGQGTVL